MKNFNLTLAILVLLLQAIGCDERAGVPINPKIEKARAWFENNELYFRKASDALGTGRNAQYPSKSLDWRSGKVVNAGSGPDIVQIPITYGTQIVASHGSDIVHNDFRVSTSAIFIEVSPGEYLSYLFKILPENPSMYNNDLPVLGDIPAAFSGYLLFFDWNEELVGGWKVEEGERINLFAVDNRDANRSTGRTAALNCYAIDTYWWSQACTSDGNCADPVLIEIITTIVCEQVIAPPAEDDPGGGGGGEPEGCFEEHPFIEGFMVPCEDGSWTLDDLQSQNRLCGAYSFLSVGDGMTAEILGLGATAVRRPSGQMLHAIIGPVCLTFGSSTGITHPASASSVFNNAWNQTMDSAETWLNSQPSPTAVGFRQFIIQTLRVKLTLLTGGYVVLSTAPCSGNVPSTLAVYCN